VTADLETYKQQAAEHALEYVQSGMALGLGTGTTARYMLEGLAARLRDGRLRDIVGVPTSSRTGVLARELGIAIVTLEQRPQLDLMLDGADEVDPALNLIKGRGGALLYEKIVASSARRLLIMADESKLVEQLGTQAPLPVEVIPFGLPLCTRRLATLGCQPALRHAADGSPYRTDEDNMILDCRFSAIPDPLAISVAIKAIPGVVEHGLFIGMASVVLIAGPRGTATLVRPDPES
jgi:ribose 5-phosphate isomerase A